MSSRGLEILGREECDALLQASDFGRVITKVGDSITAFPVFYARVGDEIIFRTDPGTKLAAAVLHTQVTFEVDDPKAGWSVMAVGYCEEVRSPEELDRALATLDQNWPEGERQRVVRVHPDQVTGRRLRASAGTAASTRAAPAPSRPPKEGA